MSSRARSAGDGLDQLGLGHEAVAGDEPGRPHHAQRVVGEGLLRGQRGPQPPGGEVVDPVEGIDQLEVREGQGHGVDGEVAPGQVGLDGVGEDDLGLAASRRGTPRPGGW